MFKKLLLPTLLLTLTAVTSCKKSNNADPEPKVHTVKLEATSAAKFDVVFGAQDKNAAFRFLETLTALTTYTKEYNTLYSGDFTAASLTGETAADINATLKVDGVVVAPSVDKKDDKGHTIKSWQIDVK